MSLDYLGIIFAFSDQGTNLTRSKETFVIFLEYMFRLMAPVSLQLSCQTLSFQEHEFEN